MQSETTVSVIIPTYNRAHWVIGAIQSVQSQTRPVDEIIVVDDGSEDDTARIIGAMPEITYLRQSRQGPAAARNLGAEHATGTHLAFLDSDDRWLPRKIEKQLDFLAAQPLYRAVYADEIWIRKGRRVNQRKRHAKYGGRIYEKCLPLCIISPSSILMARTLWEELGGFDPSLPACEDYDLWLRLAAREPVGFLAEPLIVKHGGHADQLSRQWGLDRYRVRALEKILATNWLTEAQRQLTLITLIERCRILEQGFRKRGKNEEADKYAAKCQEFSLAITR